MSSLKTSLNASDFEAPALNNESSEGPQAPDQNQQHQEPSRESKPHEESIPYQRFQEVTHENQSLRQQIAEYQQRIQQSQQYQQQQSQLSLGGMQAPQQPQQQGQPLTAQQQAVVDNFRKELEDPEKSKEWQRRIAKEGPKALGEFVERAIVESGGRMLEEYLRPLAEKISLIEGDYISNTVNQYASNVNDPEFPAYRHLFEQAVRTVAPKHNVRDPQTLDTIRYWAQAQYRAQYGNAPQQPQHYNQSQPSPYGQPPQQFQQPPVSERPGNPYGFSPQAPTQDKFANIDAQLAERFGLDVDAVRATRARTVRGG